MSELTFPPIDARTMRKIAASSLALADAADKLADGVEPPPQRREALARKIRALALERLDNQAIACALAAKYGALSATITRMRRKLGMKPRAGRGLACRRTMVKKKARVNHFEPPVDRWRRCATGGMRSLRPNSSSAA